MLNSAERAAALTTALAHQVGELATALARADGVLWVSLAADRFRDQLSEEARGVERAAGQLSQAAALLHRHARTLECLPPVVPPFLPVG